MQTPLDITFRHLDRSSAVVSLIEARAKKLESFHDNIIGCHVIIERPHRHETSGNPYRVVVELSVGGTGPIVITEQPGKHELGESLQVVVQNAFEGAERSLKKLVQRQREDVKQHDEDLAVVVKKFAQEGYGFLRTPDGEELYFHQNSVLHDDFERVSVGTIVRYTAEMGEKGPQATSVQIKDKPGARPKPDDLTGPPSLD